MADRGQRPSAAEEIRGEDGALEEEDKEQEEEEEGVSPEEGASVIAPPLLHG